MENVVQKCIECKRPLTPGKLRCENKRCLHWNVRAARPANQDTTVLLSDARLGDVEYVQTGLVDAVFGGGKGVARTSTILLGGEPGAGKTTLGLQLSDRFCSHFDRQEALYIANEQDATELKDTGSRLGLRHHDRIRIVPAMGGVADDIGEILLRHKPCFVILDSITKWVGEDLALAVQVADVLKQFAVRLRAPILIINQVTKDGGHAGLMKLQHAVDTTCLFHLLEGEIDPDTGREFTIAKAPRRIQTLKNRFGVLSEQFYRMTELGLEELILEELEEDDDE